MCVPLDPGENGSRPWSLSGFSGSVEFCPARISRRYPSRRQPSPGILLPKPRRSDAGRPSPQTQGGSHQDPPEAERPKELFAAVALVAYLVHPGDTLSGIAASHGVSLAAVETANPHLANPNLIYAGQTLEIPKTSATTQATTATAQTGTAAQSATQSATQSASTAGSPSSISTAVTQASSGGSSSYSSSDLSDIPGVPQSLAACVAYRESTDLQNPAANGNA
jgi:LysM domain